MSCLAAPGLVGTNFTWGVTVVRTPAQRRSAAAARTGRGGAYLVGALAVILAAFLGMAGIGLSNTGTAHADIFGISDAVEDWLCGVVAPDEPWEAVGDGPESWLANHNLARVSEAPVAQVTFPGDGKVTVTTGPGRAGVPDTTDQLRALPKGQYTLYEIAGLRGLSWWTIPLNLDKSRNCVLWNYIWTQSANLLFTLDKSLLQVVISLKEEASKPDPLAFLYDASGGVMNNLFVYCFIPVAMLTLLASAIWIGILSARGKANIRGTFGILAVAIAVTMLMAFLYTLTAGKAGFRQVAGGVDASISFLNATGTNAIFDGLTGNQGACALDRSMDPVARGQRLTSCVLADALAYRPWEVGQFGSAGTAPIPLPPGWSAVTPDGAGKIDVAAVIAGHKLPCYVDFESCSDLRIYLITQHGGVQVNGAPTGQQGYAICKLEGLKVGLAVASTPDELKSAIDSTANCSPMYDVFNALVESDPTAATIYSGQGAVTRVSQAFTALLAILLVGIAVVVTSVISMGWEAMTFSYFLIGPIKNGFALYAGKMKMVKEWLEDLGYSYVLRLAYGFVLAIMIVVVVWMMDSTQNFGMRLFWLAVILIGFWKIIQKIQSKLRPGESSMAPDMARHVTESTQKVGRFSGRHAVRAIPGGFGSIRATRERRQALANDPSRGLIRRRVGALTAPLAYATSGLRGAATGSSAAARARTARVNSRAMLDAVSGGRGPDNRSRPGKTRDKTGPASGKTGPTPRKAAAPNPTAVRAKDAPSSIRVAPPRRPIPSTEPAAVLPGSHSDAAAQGPADQSRPTAPTAAVPAPASTADQPDHTSGGADPAAPAVPAALSPGPAQGLRPRVIRPVVTPGAIRPRPAGTPAVQRPRLRTGGSPLGSATSTRRPAPNTAPSAPTSASERAASSAPPPPDRADRAPTTPAFPPQSPAASRPPADAADRPPPASPPRPSPPVPDPQTRPAHADPIPPATDAPIDSPPSPSVPGRRGSTAVKDRSGKGNSETGAIARRAKAAPGKGSGVTRPTTTRSPE